MKTVIGLDVGTSTIKIVLMNERREILCTERYAVSETENSPEDVVRSFLSRNALAPDQICRVMTTGAGASFIKGDILGIPTSRVPEVEVMAEGGLFLSGLEKAVVVSFGTGTTVASVSLENGARHAGGLALGGGTLSGLSVRLFGTDRFEDLLRLARAGDTCNADKTIGDISSEVISILPKYATASNLAKVSAETRDEDIAAGLFNMLYQAGGTLAVFEARNSGVDKIIAVGSLAALDLAKQMLTQVAEIYGYSFVFPPNAAYATAAGAALRAFREM